MTPPAPHYGPSPPSLFAGWRGLFLPPVTPQPTLRFEGAGPVPNTGMPDPFFIAPYPRYDARTGQDPAMTNSFTDTASYAPGTTPDHADPDRPSVQTTPEGVFYRASSLGSCTTSLAASRLGMPAAPPPEFLQAAYHQGHVCEPRIMSVFGMEGWRLAGDGDDRIPHHIPAGVTVPNSPYPDPVPMSIIGSPDGITSGPESSPIIHGGFHQGTDDLGPYSITVLCGDLLEAIPPDLYIVDAKAFSPDNFDRIRTVESLFDAFPGYAWQMATYMLGEDTFIEMGDFWKMRAGGSFTKGLFALGRKKATGPGPDDWTIDAVRLLPVDTPPKSLTEILARVGEVERAAREGDLNCMEPRFPCGHHYIHVEKDEEDDNVEVRKVVEEVSEEVSAVSADIIPFPISSTSEALDPEDLHDLEFDLTSYSDEAVTNHYISVTRALKELEEEKKKVKAEIQSRVKLDSNGKGKVTLPNATVSVYPSKTPPTLTADAKEQIMRDHGVDVTLYETQSVYTNVRVTPKKAKAQKADPLA